MRLVAKFEDGSVKMCGVGAGEGIPDVIKAVNHITGKECDMQKTSFHNYKGTLLFKEIKVEDGQGS